MGKINKNDENLDIIELFCKKKAEFIQSFMINLNGWQNVNEKNFF